MFRKSFSAETFPHLSRGLIESFEYRVLKQLSRNRFIVLGFALTSLMIKVASKLLVSEMFHFISSHPLCFTLFSPDNYCSRDFTLCLIFHKASCLSDASLPRCMLATSNENVSNKPNARRVQKKVWLCFVFIPSTAKIQLYNFFLL